MTNKKEIINGVDVSDCIFHSLTTMGYVGYNYCKCFECVCKCHNNCYYKQLKRKEQELQAQRNFTTQEQRKIYCVAYDKTCETGNECKQKKCVFKDRLKYKQALDEIRQYRVCEINDEDGEEGDVILGIIDEVEEQ